MIKILQNWEEVGRSIGYLRPKTKVYYPDLIKNWDLSQISKLLDQEKKDKKILDMGCSGSIILKYCYEQGFRNVTGIDLKIIIDRLHQYKIFLTNGLNMPYKLLKMDMTKTKFKSNSFDFIISLSVIEHGVPVNKFLKESSRLLKKGGTLFVSTDYWDKKIQTDKMLRVYGLKWKIFSKKEIVDLIKTAKEYGLNLKSKAFPEVKDKVCSWRGYKYSFISLVFGKK